MDFIKSKFKKFDVHTKTIDGVNQQTYLGALITVIAFLVVITLLVSESALYMEKDLVSRMVADSTVGVESIQLDFNIEFPAITCDKVNFLQEITRGTVHTQEPGNVDKAPTADNLGCQIKGNLLTDKAAGNFRCALQSSKDEPINLSHKIHHMYFHPAKGESGLEKIPNLAYPLNSQVSTLGQSVGIYQYVIQVVPTTYNPINGDTLYANQYSVTERQVDIDQLALGVTLSGQFFNDFVGVMFTYDFSPVILAIEERQESIFVFLSNLVGILGGVITVLGLIEGFLHTSTKALIGKKD